jgi:hypothetical protein
VAEGARPVGQPRRTARRGGRRPAGRKGRQRRAGLDRPLGQADRGAPDADLASRVPLAAPAAPVALSIMLLVLWAYAGIFLDWRRMAAWDADWAATEPRWGKRR